jgi:DNA-binding protein YbaB
MSDSPDAALQLAEARQALERLRAERARPAADDVPARRTGSALDGMARVTAEGRRLVSVELDARVLRLDPAELGRELMSAVNTALDGARSAVPGESSPVDVGLLREQLGEVLNQGLSEMHRITSSLHEAVAQIRRRASVPGDAEALPFDDLFAQTQSILGSFGTPAEPVRGVGTDPQALVRAECTGGGRVEVLAFGPGLGTVALSDGVVAAVNAALGDAESKAVQSVASGDLSAQIQSVQESSVQRMQSYSQTMQALMGGIEPRS